MSVAICYFNRGKERLQTCATREQSCIILCTVKGNTLLNINQVIIIAIVYKEYQTLQTSAVNSVGKVTWLACNMEQLLHIIGSQLHMISIYTHHHWFPVAHDHDIHSPLTISAYRIDCLWNYAQIVLTEVRTKACRVKTRFSKVESSHVHYTKSNVTFPMVFTTSTCTVQYILHSW